MAIAAAAGTLARAKRRPSLAQRAFDSANLTRSAGACLLIANLLAGGIPYLPVQLCLMVTLYFAVNTALVSGIISLVEGKPLSSVCEAWYLWSFVYYPAGATSMCLALSPPASVLSCLIWFFWTIRTKPAMPAARKAAQSFPNLRAAL